MTETSRRALFRAGALAAAAVPLAGPLVGADVAAAASAAGRLYRRSRFTPLVGTSFTVVGPTRQSRMRLTGVGDLSSARAGAEGAFALTFRSGTPGPAQDVYVLRRPGFAATTLLLVPIDADRRIYEAVVNNP